MSYRVIITDSQFEFKTVREGEFESFQKNRRSWHPTARSSAAAAAAATAAAAAGRSYPALDASAASSLSWNIAWGEAHALNPGGRYGVDF